MEIPGIDIVIAAQSRIEYLLDPDDKGGVFLALGFTLPDWPVLQTALLRHGASNQVVGEPRQDRWGIRYRVVGPLETPFGRAPDICTVWIVKTAAPDRLELLTAFPVAARR